MRYNVWHPMGLVLVTGSTQHTSQQIVGNGRKILDKNCELVVETTHVPVKLFVSVPNKIWFYVKRAGSQ